MARRLGVESVAPCGYQASKAKSGEGRPAIFGGTELDETTASIPPWLRRYKDKTRIRLTCSGTELDAAWRRPKFTELSATNFRILCDALELRVPRHKNIVPGISSTLLRCRSGVTRRRAGANLFGSSSSTWLLFLGRDGGSKMTVARDLARLVFGSYAEFTTLQVQLSPGIPARAVKHTLKRPRSPENGDDFGGRLFEAIVENPHRVILIDGVDRLDHESEVRIKNAIVGGGMTKGCNGGVVSLEDAILVLSASDFLDSRYMASSSSPWPRVKRRFNGQNPEEGDAAGRSRCRHGWDLNFCAVDGEEEEDNLADDEGIMNAVDALAMSVRVAMQRFSAPQELQCSGRDDAGPVEAAMKRAWRRRRHWSCDAMCATTSELQCSGAVFAGWLWGLVKLQCCTQDAAYRLSVIRFGARRRLLYVGAAFSQRRSSSSSLTQLSLVVSYSYSQEHTRPGHTRMHPYTKEEEHKAFA
ncbi:hypothetical protein VPH35_080439 [Triticum aestivum]|uniref:Uncharacterized protein n=1 Tax=Aegilops tauschii TaxID=37682 RepID=M8BHD7_AEGTA